MIKQGAAVFPGERGVHDVVRHRFEGISPIVMSLANKFKLRCGKYRVESGTITA